MQESTIKNLQLLAPDLLVGKLPYPPVPAIAQRALLILQILSDGKWHTAGEIAKKLGVSKKYVRDILRTCKNSWGLAFSNPKGWMLPPDSVII